MTHLKKGLWGVLATPFTGPSFDVDTESLKREVELYTHIPATGMVVLGVFGEGLRGGRQAGGADHGIDHDVRFRMRCRFEQRIAGYWIDPKRSVRTSVLK